MPAKMKNELEWNVYVWDFNDAEIRSYNIFRHAGFTADVKKITKKCKDDRAAFEEAIKNSLMYYFWSKCEWEIILSEWPCRKDRDVSEKVDVYSQVMLNWKHFIDYLWDNRRNAK